MTEAERRKLHGHYLSLNGIERNLRDTKARPAFAADAAVGDAIAEEMDQLEADFPALGLSSRIRDLRLQRDQHPYYPLEPLLTKVTLALGRIRAAREEETVSTPVTQAKEFGFVSEAGLRRILERDYLEIQKAFIAGCWKSVIILAGGSIEAILLDLALQDAARAKSSAKAPRQADLTRWDLADLIAVCVELGLVTPGVERLSSPVRDYRNLVHPGKELRSGLVFAQEEARIALDVLNIVHRDLSGGRP